MSEISKIIKLSEMKKEDADYCEECFAKIKADPDLFNELEICEKQYMAGYNPSKAAKRLTEKSGLHRYTVDLLVALYCCIRTLKLYEAHGYSEEMFAKTIAHTLRESLENCKAVYSVIGTFVFFAYNRHFRCERFALGRLHFEAVPLPFDYKDICKKGDMVLSCHIPASGPLLMEDVEEAFKLAYEFYGIKGPLVVVCSSWLLYPPHHDAVFPADSNIRRFYDLFDIVTQRETEFSAAGWRVFKTMDLDFNKFEQKTRMQKNLYKYLKDGNKMGSGYGILIRNYE